MITLCKACGTSFESTHSHPEHCNICEDERQYVPVTGQEWVELDTLVASHTNKWQQQEPNLFSIQTVPEFAIGQRAFILRTPEGNILWDCIANLDDATKTLISSLGGLKAIAISHPHYYTTMQDWPPNSTPRFICMPAIASGSCARVLTSSFGKATPLSWPQASA